MTPAERFVARLTVQPNGCWILNGSRQRIYGKTPLGGGARTGAHRFSWQLHFGPIPDGMLVCHHCDNPPCVRPDHLFLGTDADNNEDARRKGRMRPPPHPRGPDHYRVKLSDADVRDVIAQRRDGISVHMIAARYGISTSLVYNLAAGIGRGRGAP
jgi:hypothetical protein